MRLVQASADMSVGSAGRNYWLNRFEFFHALEFDLVRWIQAKSTLLVLQT